MNAEMGHVPENAQRKINGAGACVDFLRGRNPIKDTQYAKHERGEWPTD